MHLELLERLIARVLVVVAVHAQSTAGNDLRNQQQRSLYACTWSWSPCLRERGQAYSQSRAAGAAAAETEAAAGGAAARVHSHRVDAVAAQRVRQVFGVHFRAREDQHLPRVQRC